MIYKKNNVRNPKFELKLCICVVVTCIVLSLVTLKYLDIWKKSRNSHRNMFYVQLINYTMPVVQETCFDGEDMLENQFTLKKVALNIFGINYDNPIRVVNREMSCIFDNNDSTIKQVAKNEDDNSPNIKGFNLNDKDLGKGNKEDPKQYNTNSNINVYDPSLKQNLDMSKPKVFIYHTHTCESYRPSKPTNTDPNTSVCAVGDEIQKELQEKYGISVIHDKTIHDAYAYTKSYYRSGDTVDKYLNKYGDFDIIIDLHRDSVANKSAVTTKINGKNTAKFMFVVSKKNNPHLEKNMRVVNSLISIAEKDFPNLCKGIFSYNHGNRAFNQTKSNNAVLIEVGSEINDIGETKNTADCLARIMAEYFKKK